MSGKITDQQVRKLMEEMSKTGNRSYASMKAGMNRRTGSKYINLGKLPSELPLQERLWRTRNDPFLDHWPEIEQWLSTTPELEGKFLFEQLCEKYQGQYQEGQLRTLQRHIKHWRATKGPDKVVMFPQEHYPGQLMQTDYTHMNSLGVTILGEVFTHMFCHSVLTYSNWEWGCVCFSESYESIKTGIQSSLVKLGRVPHRHRTDGTTAATHGLKKGVQGKRVFNNSYKQLMNHFGMEPETVNDPNHNADVEASQNVLKKRVNQYLLFRGSRDFSSRKEYETFLCDIIEKANSLRQKRLEEELAIMKELPLQMLPLCTESLETVRPSSTIRIKNNVYSVPSRLIGEKVTVRVYESTIQVLYVGKLQLEVERLFGTSNACINYRHIIWSLMNKPGAFENYYYREELFPTSYFRKAFDALRKWHSPYRANKEYVYILYSAATTMESEVEAALILLLENGKVFNAYDVKRLIGEERQPTPKLATPQINLTEYNMLLEKKEVSV